MTVTLLQITFNTSSPTYTASTPDIAFTPLHTFTLPSSHLLDLFILDHHAQLLCVLFCIRETNHIGMYTLCGWSDKRESGEQWSVVVDMGILHVSHGLIFIRGAISNTTFFRYTGSPESQHDSSFARQETHHSLY